jgi:hypothetical protein
MHTAPLMSDAPESPDVVLVESRLDPGELRRLVAAHFEDMVKYVVDVERGSRLEDLWGAIYYPGRGEEGCIEYTSLINIRPARGNRPLARPRRRALRGRGGRRVCPRRSLPVSASVHPRRLEADPAPAALTDDRGGAGR